MTELSPREILEQLVAFPTVSRDSNLPLVDWVEDYLASHGISCGRVYDDTGEKASLYAQTGPDVAGGVVLSGHSDVVPVDGQDWVTDPWKLTEKDGKLYGRGSTDMKGFDAMAIAAMVSASKRDLKVPLQLALSYDEEVGLLGAPGLVEALNTHLPKARAVIIGEPTGMRVTSGHKGCDAVEIAVRGYEVHSSRVHEGVSAVFLAAQMVDWVRCQTIANMEKAPDEIDAMFDPPFTTLHVGMIHGGTAHNITARDCHFTIDVRTVPSQTIDDWLIRIRAEAARLEAEARRIHDDARITVTLSAPGPGVTPEPNGAAEELARRLTGDNSVNTVPYGTDGGHFQLGGFSTVICGPGDIALAHQPNEYITLDQFQQGTAFLDRLVDHIAA